jgi:hypothetical protein
MKLAALIRPEKGEREKASFGSANQEFKIRIM